MHAQLLSLLLHRRLRWLGWASLLLLLLLFSVTAARLAGGQELAQAAPSPAPSQEEQTALPTATPTRAPATPTWTPFPTATPTTLAAPAMPTVTPTPVAESPLGFLAAQPPLPDALLGPRLVPGTGIARLVADAQAGSPTATPDTWVLLPTPTPVMAQPDTAIGVVSAIATAVESTTEDPALDNTLPITDALQQPIAGGPTPQPTAAVAPTPDGSVRTVRVPILMYHYLSVPPPGADRYRVDLSVAPETFAAHLDAMQQAGYTPISLYTLLAHLNQGAPLPERPVVLTFDDGYRDNYDNAFPLLRERGMTATFFVVTDFIDAQRPEYLTWDMVREMYAGGMSIESHGRNHVSLKNKDRDYLIWQALGSLETIQYEIGVRPQFVSYPAGEFDDLTRAIFGEAGYWAGLTTVQGATHRSDDLFRLPRVRIRNSTTADELLRLLALDW